MKNEKTTLEKNIIIAGFLGYTIDKGNPEFFKYLDKHGFKYIKIDSLNFSTDWSLLMKAVQHINLLEDYRFSVTIQTMDCFITDAKDNTTVVSVDCINDVVDLINSVYEAVVEFIEWYEKSQTKRKKYIIPITYESLKYMEVTASNLQEAVEISLKEFLEIPDPNYLDDSFKIDIDDLADFNEEFDFELVKQNL